MAEKYKDRFIGFDFEDFINAPQVKVFLGKYYDTYKSLWTKDLAAVGGDMTRIYKRRHWNTLSLIFPPAWHGYHKMPTLVFFPYLTMAAWIFVLRSFGSNYLMDPTFIGLFFLSNWYLSFKEKGLYFECAADYYKKTKNMTPDEATVYMQKKGGASLAWALLWAGFALTALFVMYEISDLLFVLPHMVEDAVLALQTEQAAGIVHAPTK